MPEPYFKKGATLGWTQPSIWRRRYELRSESGVAASLQFISLFRSNALVEGDGTTWELRRASIWNHNVDVYEPHHELPFARFASQFWSRGGTVELPKGKRLKIVFSFWKSSYDIVAQSGEILVKIQRRFLLPTSGRVHILGNPEAYPELMWVVPLVWYVMMQRRHHAGAHGT